MGAQSLAAAGPAATGPGHFDRADCPVQPVRSVRSAGPPGIDDVHAWLAPLGMPAERSFRLLDRTERERAQSYIRPADGVRFAAGRACLRLVLGGYLGEDPASLRFLTEPGGRPALANEQGRRSPLGFSLAHASDIALIVVGTGPAGADIEVITRRPGLADLAAARFTAHEVACIAGGCGGSPLHGFYRHWTAREAYLKATSAGLAGLRHTELTGCRHGPAIWCRGSQAADLVLSFLDVSPRHCAAVVASRPVTSCRRLAG